MQEMSFGHRRAGIVRKEETESPAFNPMAFLQGCVAARPPEEDAFPLVVDFPDRPAKMLAAVLPDYGPASRLKTQLVDLPRLPLAKLKSTEVIVEVHSAGINPTDWKQRKGTLELMFDAQTAVLDGSGPRGVAEAPQASLLAIESPAQALPFRCWHAAHEHVRPPCS